MTKPGGTGNPARVSSPRLAPLPPASATSLTPSSANQRTGPASFCISAPASGFASPPASAVGGRPARGRRSRIDGRSGTAQGVGTGSRLGGTEPSRGESDDDRTWTGRGRDGLLQRRAGGAGPGRLGDAPP